MVVDSHFQKWPVSRVELTELNTRDGHVLSTGSCENFYIIGTVLFKFHLYKIPLQDYFRYILCT